METSAPAFIELPRTEAGLYEASSAVIMLRATNMSWREISEETGYTRLQCIQLTHNVFELTSALADVTKHHILNQRTA